MNTKVSIIIPIYNVKKYVSKCIDSAINQDFDDYEIILVDGGSTDGSGEIADNYGEKYPDKIVVIHQENKGGGARNTGIENARGMYLLFLDSDDFIEHNTLSSLYSIAKEQEADLVLFQMRTVNEEGRTIRVSKNQYPESVISLESNQELLFGQISPCSKLYSKELFLKYQIRFPENRWFEDISVAYQIFYYAKRVVGCDSVFYNYLMRSGSTMNSKKIERNIEIIDAYDYVRKFYEEKGVFEKYHEEIEYSFTNNAYIGTSIRALLVDKKSSILTELSNYADKYYKNFYQNKYLSKIEKLMCFLLRRKMYGLVKIMVLSKRRLEGYVVK